MTVDQQRVCYVSGDYRELINVNVIDVIDDIDAFTLSRVSWFYNPNVLFAVVLFEFLVVLVELSKLIRQDVCVRDEIKVLFPVAFLHAYHVEAESILSSNLMALREVIDLLILVEALVQVALAAA